MMRRKQLHDANNHNVLLKDMKYTLRRKFKVQELQAKLLSTGKKSMLLYFSEDQTWGVKLCGEGMNWNLLGKALMMVRDDFRHPEMRLHNCLEELHFPVFQSLKKPWQMLVADAAMAVSASMTDPHGSYSGTDSGDSVDTGQKLFEVKSIFRTCQRSGMFSKHAKVTSSCTWEGCSWVPRQSRPRRHPLPLCRIMAKPG